MSLTVERPGLLTTVQAGPRQARALGFPACGAADPVALRLANALVGNPPQAAALELTVSGPTLSFGLETVISVCGAPFDALLDGQKLPLWQAVRVRAGQRLSIGGAARGLRAVLAVRGGLGGLQEIYGSVSTDLRGGFGGWQGRALQRGDMLLLPPLLMPPVLPRVRPFGSLWTPTGPRHTLRVLATTELTDRMRPAFAQPFTVSPQLDRMGVRLNESVLSAQWPQFGVPNRLSLPNVPGAVQLPPDGRPIVLLPDAGTHGGYPTPLIVAGVDIPRLSQLRPGDQVYFEWIDTAGATRLRGQQEQALRHAETALRWWWRMNTRPPAKVGRSRLNAQTPNVNLTF